MNLRKKHYAIVLVGILLLTSFNVYAGHINDKDDTFDCFSFSVSIAEKQQNLQITVPEASLLVNAKSKYLLPSKVVTYHFPLSTTIESVQVYPKNIHNTWTSLEPEQMPIPIMLSQIHEGPITHDIDVKNSQWYSYDVGTGIIDGVRQKIVNIWLNPVLYDEQKQIITWCDNLEISIKKTNQKSDVYPANFEEEYTFLIITIDEYVDELTPLVNHKNNKDVSTKIVALSEITNGAYFATEGRDLQEQIKYFIKNAIESWNVLDVMLVGDSDDLPSRETHVQVSSSDNEIFVSDLYYADIYDETMNFSSWDSNDNDLFAEYNWEGETDSIDFYPDVQIGRLACINQQQVETVVSKIITYETDKAWTQNWFNNLVVIGGDTVPKDDKGVDEGELVNQAVIDLLDTFIPDKIWDSNERLSGISPSGIENIDNGINAGCGFVEFSGHGAPSVWTTFPHNGSRQSLPTPWGAYYSYRISDLSNGDKLPIALNGGCSLGKFNADNKCFAWSWLSNPDGGGIASVGCTGLGYIYIGEYVTEGLVEGMTVNMVEAYANGAVTFGDLWGNAMIDYISSSSMSGGDWKTVLEWTPFGDPTLQIAEESVPPEKPQIDGSTRGKTGESYTYSAVSTDVDENDDIYYLFDWGDETFSEWLGPYPSGEEITFDHSWDIKGDYQVRVRAKDTRGAVGEWSDPLPVSMPLTKDITDFPHLLDFLQYIFSWLKDTVLFT